MFATSKAIITAAQGAFGDPAILELRAEGDRHRRQGVTALLDTLADRGDLAAGPSRQQAVDRAARWLPRLYPKIPDMLRFVGPFHEAEARLRGHSPGVLTRKSNLFWMGEPRLPYSNESL